jgi:hypothetical protein
MGKREFESRTVQPDGVEKLCHPGTKVDKEEIDLG